MRPKTQVQAGVWLVSQGSVEIGSLNQNRVGVNTSNGFTISLKGMLTCVRWYVAYLVSLRHIEE